MKTSRTKALGLGIIPVVGFLVAVGLASFATEDDPPLVPPELVPADGNFYSVQKFDGPPLPYNPFPDLPVYALADNQFLVDDTAVNYEALTSAMEGEPPEDGPPPESPPPQSGTPFSYGCGLWLEIALTNEAAVLLTLHNTREGQGYQIWTNADLGPLAQTNWGVQTNLTGAPGDFTHTVIPMGQRTNLFFRASEWRDYVTNVVFQGLSYSNTSAFVPDTMGAVGPDHFVELLNHRIAVYTKSGGPPVAQADTTNFFSIGTNSPSVGDPRILYDPQSNRWVALAMDRTTSQQVILAVSTNQSPTNLVTGWSRHVIPLPVGTNDGDFPTVGMDGNGIYVSTLIHSGRTNLGQTIVAIRKKELYEGSGSLIMTNWPITTGPPVWTIQPAVNFDDVSTNAYAWFVAKGPPDLSSNYQGGAIFYRRLQWSGTNVTLDSDWFVVTNTAYRDYYDLDGTNVSLYPETLLEGVSAPQKDGSNIDLHQAGSRLGMTVIRNGFLWACQTVGLTNSGVYSGNETGTSVDRSGVQWLKLSVDAGAGSLSYSAHGRVYDPAPTNTFYYYYPSLMVNGAGDMLMGFSGSSATNYIGAFYSWKSAGSSTAAMPRLIRAGDGPYGDKRWGDYSATTLDPTDDCRFWTVQEYADSSGGWATVIAEIKPNP